jgi:hypothetical protein
MPLIGSRKAFESMRDALNEALAKEGDDLILVDRKEFTDDVAFTSEIALAVAESGKPGWRERIKTKQEEIRRRQEEYDRTGVYPLA